MINFSKRRALKQQTMSNGTKFVSIDAKQGNGITSLDRDHKGVAALVKRKDAHSDKFELSGDIESAWGKSDTREHFGIWLDENKNEKIDPGEVTSFEDKIGTTSWTPEHKVKAITTDFSIHVSSVGWNGKAQLVEHFGYISG